MVPGYTDILASVQVPDGIKSRQPLGTGLTDGTKTVIDAINILLSRDDVKRAGVKPSAPVAPMQCLSITVSVMTSTRYDQVQRLREDPAPPV